MQGAIRLLAEKNVLLRKILAEITSVSKLMLFLSIPAFKIGVPKPDLADNERY
jgi:hypothetical protein